MTYSAGSNILASDYNTFTTNVNSVWNSQWGQSALGSVSASGTVTATQWATLASTITNAYIHESGINPSVTSPSAGNNIAIIANLATAVSYIQANPRNCYASGAATSTDSVVGAKEVEVLPGLSLGHNRLTLAILHREIIISMLADVYS